MASIQTLVICLGHFQMNLVMSPAAILFPSSLGEAGLEDVPFLICFICVVATSSHGYVKSPEGKFSKEKLCF